MSPPDALSLHVLRARRTAAVARAVLALCAMGLLAADRALSGRPLLAALGFVIILGTALVQLVAPRADWLKMEESFSPAAGILIVGLGDQRVTVLSVLWLAAVASGVLARGGRVHSIGRVLLLAALLLPVVLQGRLGLDQAGLCAATIALLLTCGRLTRELSLLLGEARHDADHDNLTGALSRPAFRATLDRMAAAPSHDSEHEAALLLIDLDDFGQVNKARGHAAGDALLATVVARMTEEVGSESIVGRLGGDEFAVLVTGEDPGAVARRLLDALAAPGTDGSPVPASVGIARIPRDGRDADSLLRAGDVALRVAKRSGKQQVSSYAGESLADEGPTGALGALRRLIDGDGLAMAVQPIVDLRTGEVHAYEALARFKTRGTSSPLHWFALADEFGVRDELELACLTAALRLLPELPAGSLLSVNLSGTLLADPRTLALLEAQSGLDGLIVEITEDSLLRESAGLHAATTRLLAQGVRFAVDDVGAGYSGLRQITTLHPSYLKLDRGLVSGIDADPDRAALISALLGYARQTGGHLVAEGVETAQELETLENLGVPLVQGFLLARPGAPWPGVAALPWPKVAAAQTAA